MFGKSSLKFVTACLCLGAAAIPATAQTGSVQAGSTVPEAMPFDIPYGAPIALADAKRLVEAAETEARRHNWKYAIVVVDPWGEVILMQKMDGTQLASIQIALAKASTAARMRRATKLLQDRTDGGSPSLLSLPNIITSEGGLPLIAGGKIIGAIGASGGTGAQDTMVAQAGVAVLR